MRDNLLLPNQFKVYGWLLLLISIFGWLYVTITGNSEIEMFNTNVFAFVGSNFFEETVFFKVIKTNITFTLIGLIFIIGGLIIIFSKERIEDEFIEMLRLKSFKIAFLINYLILLLLFIFIYGVEFINILIYNQFTMIIIFIIVFEVLLYRNKISAK